LLRIFFIGVGCVCLSLVWVLSLASDKSTGKEKMKRLANTNELVLFDFNSDVSVLAWRAVNDTVMGGGNLCCPLH
jgi:hypothetical protein